MPFQGYCQLTLIWPLFFKCLYEIKSHRLIQVGVIQVYEIDITVHLLWLECAFYGDVFKLMINLLYCRRMHYTLCVQDEILIRVNISTVSYLS